MRPRIQDKQSLTLFGKIGYGMGNFSYGIVSQMIGFYIVFYATSVLGISGGLVGLAVSISVIWDAVTDPIMGYISDITKSKRFGRRHGYILFGVIAMAITTLFLYSINPSWSNTTKFNLLLILLLLSKTFTTIYITPLSALAAELSDNYEEKTSIQSIKIVFFLSGIISTTGMGLAVFFNPTKTYPNGQLNPQAYQNMGIAVAILALAFGLVSFFSTFKYIPNLPKPINSDGHSLRSIFRSMLETLKNSNYRLILIGYLFTNIAPAIFSTIGLHVYTYTFQLSNKEISLLFGIQFAVCIITQPIWLMIARRIDKKPTVMLGLIISMFGSLLFAFLAIFHTVFTGNVYAMIPFTILSGLGLAALFSLPPSMIADTVDVEELNTGERKEGTYFGLVTLANKLSQAVAIFMLGNLLDLVNFNTEAVIQPKSTVTILGLTIAIGSFLGFLIALYFYSKYTLNAKKVSEIHSQIQAKKSAIAK